jgi:hypothetical protein
MGWLISMSRDSEKRTDCSSKNFRKYFCLFNLGAIHLTPNHRAERNLGTEFLRNGEREGRFTSSWGTGEQECTAREFAGLDEFDDYTTGLHCSAIGLV